MSDGDRSERVALVAVTCTVLIFLIGLWAGTHYQKQWTDDQQSRSEPEIRQANGAAFWSTHSGTADSYQAICDAPVDNGEADLCQQWRTAQKAEEMAGYTLASLIFGFVGLVGVGVTVILSNKATTAATDATRAANEANRLIKEERRPWLDFDLITIDNVSVNAGQLSMLKIKSENVGKSIAYDCRFFCAFYEGGTKEQKIVAPIIIEQAFNWPHPGFPVLIERPKMHTEIAQFPSTMTGKGHGAALGSVGLMIVLKYSDAGKKETFYTAKNYLLWRGDSMVFMKVGDKYGTGAVIPSLDANRTIFK